MYTHLRDVVREKDLEISRLNAALRHLEQAAGKNATELDETSIAFARTRVRARPLFQHIRRGNNSFFCHPNNLQSGLTNIICTIIILNISSQTAYTLICTSTYFTIFAALRS